MKRNLPSSSGSHKHIWTLTGCIERDATPQTIEVSKSPFQIGRRPDLDLSLNSEVISGQHAEILETAGVLQIRDLGSTNGTFVNGNPVDAQTVLAEGDWIELGDLHLKVEKRGVSTPHFGRLQFLKTRLFSAGEESDQSRGLAELISSRALGPCFQPIHRMDDRDIHGYEFLARSEVNSVNTPGEMFIAAEAAGREVELSLLCREMGIEHSICLPKNLPLFLNTHPNEPLMQTVVPQMEQLREVYPQRPLVLEIHEGAVTEPNLIRELRSALNDFGVRLAFDDFGAGQARIRELICAPSDYIKFDAALIRDLQNVSKEQLRMFRSIIYGVRNEGAITVAEGVETEEMVELCAEVGFDLLQGYAMSRPAIMYPAGSLSAPDATF